MNQVIIPENYHSVLSMYETQDAIGIIKEMMQKKLCMALRLKRGLSWKSIWPASKSVSMRDSSARNWIWRSTARFGNGSPSVVSAAGSARSSVRPAPVSTFRRMRAGRPAGGCAAGIRAASRFSRCIRRDITRVRCKAPAGASEYCINSRTCPNGSDRPAVPVADAARGPAR